MYGIFEIINGRKVRAFHGATFRSIDIALSNMSPVAHFEIDEEFDAADFFTSRGQVFAIERVA